MVNFGRSTLLLAALLSFGFPAVAHAQTANDGEVTCLAIGHLWAGTADDVKKIHEMPVPSSFRVSLEGGGCGAWQLIRTGLVDWHLAFGDEATTSAALAYLEQQMSRGAPARLNLVAEVEAATRGHGGTRPRMTVGELVGLATSYQFIAKEYVRAADFYTSPVLLARSRRYADAAIAVARLLRSERPDVQVCAPADRRCAERWANLRNSFDDFMERSAPDLDMHVAVVSAQLGGTEADFAAARAIFARNDDPNYAIAGTEAYKNGDDFCDVGDRNDLAEWHEACEDGNFDRAAMTYWHYRARFDQAAREAGFSGLGGQWDTETALRLWQAEIENHADGLPERRFGEVSQRITELRFGQAEALLAKARRERQNGNDDYYEALVKFWASAYLVQGSDHPGWLRRIGTRYIEACNELLELERTSGDTRPLPPDIQRRAAWFKTILPQLDTLAGGAQSINGR